MEQLITLVEAYASEVRRLRRSHSTTEQTYYPAVRDLWTGILKKWLGYRHVERRGGTPMTLAEQRYFRSMVQRIATVLAMTANLDAAYTRASGAAFTAEGLGVR